MKKTALSILFYLALQAAGTALWAQTNENEPVCTHVIRHKATPAFLQYLFKTYGIEEAEQIILRMQVYEAEQQVKVLFSKDFYVLMEKFETLLSQASNQEEVDRLNAQKALFVKFETIENLLN